ncbi:hypothetical protein Pmani_020381 [Petrolisthes manimaculis]|uniref:Uncharacterized protein n=1 Tax=Petrolisthes manimaculis TaxID=1843537 RepID=A0AAE1PIT8_9EUCA|nr:hypothetical protein Pmani_020381 [Petrolisthes manimaculis]
MALLSCHLTIVLLCLWVAVETAPADARIQVDNPPPPNSSSISFLSSSARTSPFFRTFLKSEFDNLAVNYLRLRVGVNGSEAVISSNCSHSAAARHTYPAASSPSEAFDVEGWSTRGQQPPLGRATQHEGQKDSITTTYTPPQPPPPPPRPWLVHNNTRANNGTHTNPTHTSTLPSPPRH